jgi:hypothetical protein
MLVLNPACLPACLPAACVLLLAPQCARRVSQAGSEQGEHDGACRGDPVHPAGEAYDAGAGHSLSSGAHRANPVAAMPGLVIEPLAAKAVVALMAADSRDKVGPAWQRPAQPGMHALLACCCACKLMCSRARHNC